MKVNIQNILVVSLIIIALLATVMVFIFGYQMNLYYTDEELQALYEKYNITENDLKYAKGELPGPEIAIIQNNTRVIVTKDGLPPGNMVKGVDYDEVLSKSEWLNLNEKADAEFMEKYGVDPYNPKLDYVGGYYLPIQEVERLADEGRIAYM